MRRAIRCALLALEFLTVLRLRRAASYAGADLGASLAWFPLVGLLIGGTMLAADTSLAHVLTPAPRAALLAALLVVLTGALHLDGLADCADGIFGGHTPERRLEIMRDSRSGSFGVVAIALALLLLLAAYADAGNALHRALLLVAPVLSRLAMVIAVALFPYARPAGLGRLYHEHARPWPLVLALVSGVVIVVALLGAGGAVLAALAAAVALLFGRFATGRLGGLTGDVYGATGMLVEIAVWYSALALGGRGWLTPSLGL